MASDMTLDKSGTVVEVACQFPRMPDPVVVLLLYAGTQTDDLQQPSQRLTWIENHAHMEESSTTIAVVYIQYEQSFAFLVA